MARPRGCSSSLPVCVFVWRMFAVFAGHTLAHQGTRAAQFDHLDRSPLKRYYHKHCLQCVGHSSLITGKLWAASTVFSCLRRWWRVI